MAVFVCLSFSLDFHCLRLNFRESNYSIAKETWMHQAFNNYVVMWCSTETFKLTTHIILWVVVLGISHRSVDVATLVSQEGTHHSVLVKVFSSLCVFN